MPFQGGPIQFYGGGNVCHGDGCEAELPDDGDPCRADWFIKLSAVMCPDHHPDRDKAGETDRMSRPDPDAPCHCGHRRALHFEWHKGGNGPCDVAGCECVKFSDKAGETA